MTRLQPVDGSATASIPVWAVGERLSVWAHAGLLWRPGDVWVRLELDRHPDLDSPQVAWLTRDILGAGLRQTVHASGLRFGPGGDRWPWWSRLVLADGVELLLPTQAVRRFVTDVDVADLVANLPTVDEEPVR